MVEEASWLLRMQHENLDLKKPIKLNKLKERLQNNPGIFIRNENGILGHANLQRMGSIIELHTVVIDPDFRGEGHSHKLVYSAWERWRQDPILHGSYINSKVNFSKEAEGSNEDLFLPCKLIAFTRNASLASTLTSAGFKIAIPKRKWWNLWLVKSQLGHLKINQLFYLLLNRGYTLFRLLVGEVIPENNEKSGFIKRFFQKRRRLFHQLSHLSEYKLFILSTEMQNKDWPRKGGPNEEYYHPLEEINVATFTKEKEIDPEEITEWDSGEKEKIPYVDLAQE
ncbi:MAG: Uncharacterised protein [Methanobacteriota archaeon]|nr:MAG: Uncharacterised protein [Euryarchaeota archaeon]